MSNWLHFDSGECDPAMNMAMDDVLLLRVAEIGSPVLRFYDWSEPAATFGYFQKIAELEVATQIRPLIRRPTGGGLVPHLADWTYSFVVPPTHDWHSLRAEESYRRMHEWIRDSLGSVGVACDLADCCKKVIPGQCFEGYEKFDVLQDGRKIAGAAQRRNKHGLLIQGSIQPTPPNVRRTEFIESMCKQGNDLLAGGSVEFDPSSLLATAEEVAEERYRSVAHNRRR